MVAHRDLGFGLNPGKFEVIMNGELSYQVTHSKDSIRTSAEQVIDDANANIAVFGCSYTYGLGENDIDVFSAKLEKLLDGYNIRNYAVPGYGNVQGYLQLRSLVSSNRKPDIAIFNFADFHLQRNVLSPEYRSHLSVAFERAQGDQKLNMASSEFPYLELEGDSLTIKKHLWSDMYTHWYGRNFSALVNALQTGIDKINVARSDQMALTVRLFQQINNYCLQHGIRLIVTGLRVAPETSQLLTELSSQQIEVLDMSLPLREKQYHHWPVDTHPNKAAHEYFANRLAHFLKTSKTLTLN